MFRSILSLKSPTITTYHVLLRRTNKSRKMTVSVSVLLLGLSSVIAHMRVRPLIAWVLAVIVLTAGCASFFGADGTNDTATPTLTDSTEAKDPLRGVVLWISGQFIEANQSALVLDTGKKQLALNTTHAIFFESNGGQQQWTSVDTLRNKETGVNICLSAHVHKGDVLHLVKAFYNSTCTPLAK